MNFEIALLMAAALIVSVIIVSVALLLAFALWLAIYRVDSIERRLSDKLPSNNAYTHNSNANTLAKKDEPLQNEEAKPVDLPDFWNNKAKLEEAREKLVSNINDAALDPIFAGLTDQEAWKQVDQRILDLENPREK